MATDTPDETPVEEEIPTEDEISITFDEVDDDPAASEPVLNLDLGGDDEADDETEISLNFGQDEAEEVVDPSDTEAVAVAALRSELRSKFGEWYVVHTYSGMENRVKQNLEQRVKALNMEDYIFEAVVPTEEVVEIRNGSRKTVTRTSHPGYVLVRMELTDDSWSAVRHTPSWGTATTRSPWRSTRWSACSREPRSPRRTRPMLPAPAVRRSRWRTSPSVTP